MIGHTVTIEYVLHHDRAELPHGTLLSPFAQDGELLESNYDVML